MVQGFSRRNYGQSRWDAALNCHVVDITGTPAELNAALLDLLPYYGLPMGKWLPFFEASKEAVDPELAARIIEMREIDETPLETINRIILERDTALALIAPEPQEVQTFSTTDPAIKGEYTPFQSQAIIQYPPVHTLESLAAEERLYPIAKSFGIIPNGKRREALIEMILAAQTAQLAPA